MANTQIRTGNEKQTETKHLCGDYISRKGRRERGVLISPTVHADAGGVASFTTTGERRGRGD
jgi:hypothetical protein